jgi:two-component system cell cycle response regulator DivK
MVGVRMTKKVLIVEDNELNMKLFHDLLEAQGYETLQTREGLQALSIAREHRPDLILMDIQLPEISGLEVTKWLKEDDDLSHIPVVAVTAFAMKGDEERIREGGCEAYISKPISVSHFLDTIKPVAGEVGRERAHPGRRRHRGQCPPARGQAFGRILSGLRRL